MDSIPTVTVQRKTSQMLITIALIVLLFAIAAGYIYYGMYLAKQTAPVAETPVVEDTNTTITSEERQAIIDSLSQEAPPTISKEREAEIITSLQEPEAPVEQTPEEEARRAAIIESLKQ